MTHPDDPSGRAFPDAVGDRTTWRDLERIAGCGCVALLAALGVSAWLVWG